MHTDTQSKTAKSKHEDGRKAAKSQQQQLIKLMNEVKSGICQQIKQGRGDMVVAGILSEFMQSEGGSQYMLQEHDLAPLLHCVQKEFFERLSLRLSSGALAAAGVEQGPGGMDLVAWLTLLCVRNSSKEHENGSTMQNAESTDGV